MITRNISGVIPAAEKGRAASVIGIPWNAWFFKVGLYHCMALRYELENDNVSRVGSQVVWVV